MANVTFSVVAETVHGSSVRAVGSADALGRWEPQRGLALQTEPGQYPRWSASLRVPLQGPPLEYKFVIFRPDGPALWEEGPNRLLAAGSSGRAEAQTPRFRGTTASSASSPARRKGEAPDAGADCEAELSFEAVCTDTQPGDVVRVVGSAGPLGSWEPTRGLKLETSAAAFPRWSGSARCRVGASVEWKLVVSRADGSVLWEPCENRRTTLPGAGDGGWIVRAHFGGACGALEQRKAGRAAPRSNPVAPPNPAVPAPHMRRTSTDYGSPPASSSWMAAAPLAAPAEQAEANPVKWARSSSLSHFSAMVGQPSAPLPGAARTRARTATAPAEDQLISLSLEGVRPTAAAAARVEAVFEADGSKWRLRHEPHAVPGAQARWVLNLTDTALEPGLLALHFLVNGRRMLSRDLLVFGDSNAVLFNEPIRRYIQSRDGAQSQTPPHMPLSHTNTVERFPTTHGFGFTDDTEVGMPGHRQGNLARPYSICGNLAALGEEEESSTMDSKNTMANFSKEVFDGLYDGELRLRMDGYVLPEPPAAKASQRALRLWSGAHLLKKKVGSCEDAYFASTHSLGVADGVGCMVQFASYGINAAAYAAELMAHADGYLQAGDAGSGPQTVSARAVAALSAAEKGAQAYGASTITVLTMEGSSVGVANLGDSGFMLLRKGHRGMTVVQRSEEQQHSWNCPYQLTRLPPALTSRFPKLSLDTAADCEQYSFTVREGDLLLLFSDGLRDNLHDREILHILDCALSPAFGRLVGLHEQSTPPERLARALALAAQERSFDPVAKVPFVEYSKKHGYECQGGKQDDITVVAAWVVPEQAEPNGDGAGMLEEEPQAAAPALSPSRVAAAAAPTDAKGVEAATAGMARMAIGAEAAAAGMPRTDTVPAIGAELAAAGMARTDTLPVICAEAPAAGMARTDTLLAFPPDEDEESAAAPVSGVAASSATPNGAAEGPEGAGARSEPKPATSPAGAGARGQRPPEASSPASEAAAQPARPKAPEEQLAPPAKPVGQDKATAPAEDACGDDDDDPSAHQLQPMYETPRRGLYEPPAPAAGAQRRPPPSRAEFRPMSSSKGRGSSKNRGGMTGARRKEK